MNVLQPMTPEDFASFAESSIRSYAHENVVAGRWPVADALERAAGALAAALPQGLDTPDHHLCLVRAANGETTVGHLWYAVEQRQGQRCAYVYDIAILEAHRRQGHAQRALDALAQWAAARGIASMALHVFAHNPGAQALYQRLGFQVTGFNMQKTLDLPGGEATPAARG